MRDIDRIERIEFGCFSCGKMISCDSDLDCPSGAVVFDGGSSFGSSLYDSLVDGVSVRILVCDDCLKAKCGVLRETLVKSKVFPSEVGERIMDVIDKTEKDFNAYGYCPECGAPGRYRERRPNGNDKCENGHTYPPRDSVGEKE